MNESRSGDDRRAGAGPEADAGDQERGPTYTVNDRRWWVPQPEGAPPGDPAPDRKPTYVENLEAQLEEKTQMLRRYAAEHRAALADLERAKERIEREAGRELGRQKRAMLVELLPVVDDLDRALEAARRVDGAGPVLDGVDHVRRGFLARLERLGVTRSESLGLPFDPALHEAVAALPVRDPDLDGTVVAVSRPGYLLDGEVLRPAEVAVGKLAS